MIFLTLTISLKRAIKLILVVILTINLLSNGEKLSIQLQEHGRKYSTKDKKIALT